MKQRSILAAMAIAFTCFSASRLAGETAGARPYVVVLGIAQDGGRPQTGCARPC